MATNEEVQLGAFDESIVTRVKPIELEGEIPEHMRRPISEVMVALAEPDERSRLLTWLVLGARTVVQGQFALAQMEPAKVSETLQGMVYDQDQVRGWLDLRCNILATGDRPELVTAFLDRVIIGAPATALYQDYQIWAQAKTQVPVSQITFTRRIRQALRITGVRKVRGRLDSGELVTMLPITLR